MERTYGPDQTALNMIYIVVNRQIDDLYFFNYACGSTTDPDQTALFEVNDVSNRNNYIPSLF